MTRLSAMSIPLVFLVFSSVPSNLQNVEVILEGRLSRAFGSVEVEITKGKGAGQTFQNPKTALVQAGYSAEAAETIVQIVFEAYRKTEGGWSLNVDTPPVPVVTKGEAYIVLEAKGSVIEFTLFSGPSPQDDKNCRKISDNCVSCPGGLIHCNAPKPAQKRF